MVRVRLTRYGPDGYRYGIMFQDGSVVSDWDGSAQRESAEDWAEYLSSAFPQCRFWVVRRTEDGKGWELPLP